MRKFYLIVLLVMFTVSARGQSEVYQQKKMAKLAVKSPFEKIWDGELPAEVVYKDEEIIAFVPLRRQTPVHYLIVPKKRIATINDLKDDDALLVGKMFLVARDLAKQYGIAETGYRLAINTNEDAGQSVFHLHLHLLGGMKTGPMVDQTYKDPNPRKGDE
ncbi:histidine triad nucleotide-binding protein [Fulvivirga sp. M361]|uniref:histidine triad nucleotide-binding protein n=1 Tax=Fulvivirga sp. M361 TaxID=2594266 RepID=UPI001C870873|nr:histidine triad nucleotide-binding protein [Fulvivirga sp. M361]